MLVENLAEQTFPLKRCIRRGTAQSVRRSNDSSRSISNPRFRAAIGAFTEERGMKKCAILSRKVLGDSFK